MKKERALHVQLTQPRLAYSTPKLHQPPNLLFFDTKARYHDRDASDVPLNAPGLRRVS